MHRSPTRLQGWRQAEEASLAEEPLGHCYIKDTHSDGVFSQRKLGQCDSMSPNPLTRLPQGLSFTSAAARPDLWKSVRYDLESHGFKKISTWHSNALHNCYWQLGEEPEFAPLQTLVTDQTGSRVVGIGACVPFYWQEFAAAQGNAPFDWAWSLPDAGWDAVLTQGFQQLRARQCKDKALHSTERPNAISALLVHVVPDYRTYGVADAIIGHFKTLARIGGFQTLIVPVKPTRKSEYLDVSMDEYITWSQDKPRVSGLPKTWMLGNDPATEDTMPFDPWLRKHVALGARVIKVAPDSFTVQGTAAEWKKRLGDAVQLDTVTNGDGQEHFEGDKLDGVLFNGLPIRWDANRGLGYHSEPDVWVIYEL